MGNRQSPQDKKRAARDQERNKQQPRRQDEQADVERVEKNQRSQPGGKPGGDMDF
ncbi:hypothetical protein ACFQ0X_02880 [Streptomyces rectiviolaceus]|uniref:Small hydrophilic protein n=1 Tax=Streptomyces rectiviolaceus TaxID=332591 RepID=A0ABP6M9X3_9ACTN